ncbi:hypothetical protein [Streptomyces sp. NPDC001297]|uniref:hypothetical protein n=1 Tax=Streptomyces sp. NPDC001297 TaxID=3364559 RepID=UPI0036CBAA89
MEKERPAAEPETPPAVPEPQDDAGEGRTASQKKKRPTSIPFYPNPEHEAFLWRVTAVASERQKRIPATAVLRLALARLEQQMTPSEIVQMLGEVEQPGGRMGRPRL